MSCIEVRGATKGYDNKNLVLNGLNLTLQTGSMLVIKYQTFLSLMTFYIL